MLAERAVLEMVQSVLEWCELEWILRVIPGLGNPVPVASLALHLWPQDAG